MNAMGICNGFGARAAQRLRRDERGAAALLVALMAILLMMALATALILAASVESRITRNFRGSSEALYAADAVLERAVDDLRGISDWNASLAGVALSAFTDGPWSGTRTLADGQQIDLGEIVSLANCRQRTPCSGAAMDATTSERPWGSNNPRWQPFAWGYVNGWLPTVESPFYVVAMVGDDPSENDSDPLTDGSMACAQEQATGCNPGTGRLALRAEAFGPFGAYRILESTIARSGTAPPERDPGDGSGQPGIRILSWREVR